MARNKLKESVPVEKSTGMPGIPEPKRPKEYIGIMVKNFRQCTSYGPHVLDRSIKNWDAMSIIKNKTDIDELVKLGAPIEVYYRYVDGSTED